MCALKQLKNAYNAGELSPYMDGRTDLNKYYNGASQVINALILPHGGFTKRPGTIYKAASPTKANLTSFEFSVDDALVLEWSNVLLRFYKDQAIVNKGVGTEDISGLNNVVAHWLLNETEGVDVIDDDGATHDGTSSTDIANVSATGKVGSGCFNLDGQYDIEISDHNDFSFTDNSDDDPFSIACWANITNKGGVQVLISKWRDANTTQEWRLSVDENRKLQLQLVDSSVTLASSRIAHWKLNEDAADKNVLDDDATSHDGLTQTDNTADLTATGKVGACLDFGGADAVVITNDHNELSYDDSGTNPFSISAWVYHNGNTGTNHILSKHDETTGAKLREWRFVTVSQKLYLYLYDESANAYQSRRTTAELSVGWHHVVATYDSTGGSSARLGINIYVDNVAVSMDNISNGTYTAMENTTTKVIIGGNTNTAGAVGNFWDDKIDNVMLFNVELSASNVSALWNDGNGTETLSATNATVSAVSTTALSTGWRQLACTYSAPADETTAADGIILYVDGVAVTSTKTNNASYTAMQNGAEEVRIGSQRNSGDTANENFWEDKIDEMSMFSDVLTPTEVASLYSTTPYSITSPYTTAQAFEIHYTQSADVMYIAHNDVHPKKLSRLDTLEWTIEDVPFTGGPFLAENTTDASLVQFARVGGTAEADYYFPADTTGTLTATGTGNEPFNVNMVSALWLVKHTRVTNNSTSTFNNDTNATPGTGTTYATDDAVLIKGDATVTFEPIATTKIAMLWRKEGNGSWQKYRSFRASAAFSWTEDADDVYYCMTRVDNTIAGTLTSKEDINYGIVKITGYTSATVVTCTVVDPVLTDNAGTSATTSEWAEGAWSTYRGFPRTVGFHEDRLWWASSTNDPDKKWSSKSGGRYEDMGYTTGLDDEAVTAIVKDNEVSQIQWMMSRRVMAIGGANREYSLSAQNPDDPITPLDKVSRPQTGFSSDSIQPVMLNDSIFFLQRSGKKMGAMRFDSVTENFEVDDATLLAYGLLDSKPTNMAVSRSPDSAIWVVRTDGVMPTFTFEPKEEVQGWGRQIFGNSAAVETPTGVVESVAVIHGSSEDEIWVNVKRTIDSSTVYYTELFAPRSWGDDIEDAKFVDSLVTYDGAASSAMTGGLHLKGETVSVFADGEVFDDAVVSGTGTFTLKKATVTTTASVVQYGLPYTMKVKSMRLAVPQTQNALQADVKRITKVAVRYIRSLLGSAGTEYDIKETETGADTQFTTDIGALYSTAAQDTPKTKRAIEGGFQEAGHTIIISDDPVPFTALSAVTEVEV